MLSPRTRHPSSPALRLLRASLAAPSPAAALLPFADRLRAGGIVREAARTVDFRRALPSLAVAIDAAGLADALPADERALLAAARLSGTASAARVGRTLLPLGAAVGASSTRALLLKGAALHGALYPDAGLRPVADADVYVPPADAPAFRRALDAAGLVFDAISAARWADNVASQGRAHRLSDFLARPRAGGGIAVEVKLDPVQVGVPLRRGEAFLEAARPSPAYPGFLVPSAEAMATQQAIHLARHDGADLLWWSELARGIALAHRAGAFDPTRVEALVGPEGLAGVVRAAFVEAEALFPGSIPAAARARPARGPVLARFRRTTPRPGGTDERAATWGLQAAHAATAGRPLSLLASLWRRVWPSAGYVRARLRLPPDARIGFATHFSRWARLGREPSR